MVHVQNSLVSKEIFLESALLMSFAVLAGSTRLIEFFPNTTRRGIIFAGTMGSTSAFLYNYKFHDPDQSFPQTLLRKAALIALATLSVPILAKSFKDHLALSFSSAAKMALAETAIAAIATYVNQESELEQKHRHYSTTMQREWRALSKEDRTALAKEFYDAGLPAISLIGAPVNLVAFDNIQKIPPKMNQYTPQQLSWLREVVCLSPSENVFSFMKRCREAGIPMIYGSLDPCLDMIRKSPEHIEMIYQQCKQTPVFQFIHNEAILNLFVDKERLPTFEACVQTLAVSEIETMRPDEVILWYNAFEKMNSQHWLNLSEPLRRAFIQRFFEFQETGPGHPFSYATIDCQWLITWLNETEDLKTQPINLRWCKTLLEQSTQGLSFQKIDHLNTQFKWNLPFTITSEVVAAVRGGSRELKGRILQLFTQRDLFGKDFGFFQLSIEEQEELRTLIPNCQFPYQITPQIIERAKKDLGFFKQLITQFLNNGFCDFGLLALPEHLQEDFRNIGDDNDRFYTPVKLSREMVIKAEKDPYFLKKLILQLNISKGHFDYFGFFELNAADQLKLSFLAGGDSAYFFPHLLTAEIVNEAKGNPMVLKTLKYQFECRHKHNHARDFGFQDLPQASQDTLKALFKVEAHFLPQSPPV